MFTVLCIKTDGSVTYDTTDNIRHSVLKRINGVIRFKQVHHNFGLYQDDEPGAKRLKPNPKAQSILKQYKSNGRVFGTVVFVGLNEFFEDVSIPSCLGSFDININ